MTQAEAPTHTGWAEMLRGGTPALIRPIRKDDASLERRILRGLPDDLRRCHFLGLVRNSTEDVVRALTCVDAERETAFIAVVSLDGRDSEVGVARFVASADGKSCDCSITIAPEWRRRGIGTLLMQHLIDAAKARGIRRMYTSDPIDGTAPHELATRIGFRQRPDPEDPAAVIYELDLVPTAWPG